jgi:DNA-binding response OmpR family regulator
MTQESIHTIVVTQDQEWLASLCGQLLQNGFAALTIAQSSDKALDLFHQAPPRLVLLDLQAPNCNAVDLCVEMLLAHPLVKIVLVSESTVEPPLAALHAGVSGCINRDVPAAAWPGLLTYVLNGGMAFNHSLMESILAEVWSAQKRQPLMAVGPLRIDLARRMVVYAGRRIPLTPREFALLTCLTRNTDRVVTFDQLLNEAWGYDADDGTPAQVRLYVARLRRKLTDVAQTPDFILTERGVGYRLHSSALHRATPPPAHFSRQGYVSYPARTIA